MIVDVRIGCQTGPWYDGELDCLLGSRIPYPNIGTDETALVRSVDYIAGGGAVVLRLDTDLDAVWTPPQPDRPVDAPHAPVGTFHPETSQRAAARALARSGTDKRRVYDYVLSRGPLGATDDQIEQALDLPHQTASARRNGLVADGWLRWNGEERPTRTDSPARVWVAIPEEN